MNFHSQENVKLDNDVGTAKPEREKNSIVFPNFSWCVTSTNAKISSPSYAVSKYGAQIQHLTLKLCKIAL